MGDVLRFPQNSTEAVLFDDPPVHAIPSGMSAEAWRAVRSELLQAGALSQLEAFVEQTDRFLVMANDVLERARALKLADHFIVNILETTARIERLNAELHLLLNGGDA